MKILVLQGSPRKKGNTAAVLKPLIAAAKAEGATVETIELARRKIGGCRECFACQRVADKPGCAVRDDAPKVLDKMLKADVLVLATPVFCWGPSAQLKALLDRMICLFKFQEDEQYTCLLKGKGLALVASAGGGKDDGVDLVSDAVRRLAKFSGCRWRGELLATLCKTPAQIAADKRLMARAARLGRKLAG